MDKYELRERLSTGNDEQQNKLIEGLLSEQAEWQRLIDDIDAFTDLCRSVPDSAKTLIVGYMLRTPGEWLRLVGRCHDFVSICKVVPDAAKIVMIEHLLNAPGEWQRLVGDRGAFMMICRPVPDSAQIEMIEHLLNAPGEWLREVDDINDFLWMYSVMPDSAKALMVDYLLRTQGEWQRLNVNVTHFKLIGEATSASASDSVKALMVDYMLKTDGVWRVLVENRRVFIHICTFIPDSAKALMVDYLLRTQGEWQRLVRSGYDFAYICEVVPDAAKVLMIEKVSQEGVMERLGMDLGALKVIIKQHTAEDSPLRILLTHDTIEAFRDAGAHILTFQQEREREEISASAQMFVAASSMTEDQMRGGETVGNPADGGFQRGQKKHVGDLPIELQARIMAETRSTKFFPSEKAINYAVTCLGSHPDPGGGGAADPEEAKGNVSESDNASLNFSDKSPESRQGKR